GTRKDEPVARTYLIANEGRVMPEGTAGLVILAVAIAALRVVPQSIFGRCDGGLPAGDGDLVQGDDVELDDCT
ncbi:hypothetical protein ACFTXB_35595, partial [Streptomyces sp. NPDC057074]|uniref:hypothetical protein n=1 Tax=Streptomyces sp. NPDC057074 TaxID=3346015 RepID=UPI00363E08E6